MCIFRKLGQRNRSRTQIQAIQNGMTVSPLMASPVHQRPNCKQVTSRSWYFCWKKNCNSRLTINFAICPWRQSTNKVMAASQWRWSNPSKVNHQDAQGTLLVNFLLGQGLMEFAYHEYFENLRKGLAGKCFRKIPGVLLYHAPECYDYLNRKFKHLKCVSCFVQLLKSSNF